MAPWLNAPKLCAASGGPWEVSHPCAWGGRLSAWRLGFGPNIGLSWANTLPKTHVDLKDQWFSGSMLVFVSSRGSILLIDLKSRDLLFLGMKDSMVVTTPCVGLSHGSPI